MTAADVGFAAGSIAGIPEIKCRYPEAVILCGFEQAGNRVASAGLLVMNSVVIEIFDGTAGVGIHSSCRLVIMVMTQVRRDHDQRFVTAP